MNHQLNSLKCGLLFLLLSISTKMCFSQVQNSEIKTVTVYLDGAEINREAAVKLKAGKSEITLQNLSPYIEESSIQISGLDKASILSINYGINYLTKNKQNDSIVALQNELKTIEKNIQYQNNLISGYNEELSLIQNNKKLGNANEVVSLEKLKTFATYYRTRITALKTDINTSHSKIDDFKHTQIKIQQQLAEFNVEEKTQTGEIKLKLNSEIATTLNLKIKYNIKNAGWFPIYDLKAEKINSPINLEYKAHVYQNSGCDWADVNLVLSTSDPNTNNEKPTVNPKYLNFISPYSQYNTSRATKSYNYKYNPLVKTVSGVVTTASDGLPVPGVSVIEKGTSNGVQTDFDGKYTLNTTSGNTIVYSYVGMSSEELPIHSSIMNVTLTEDRNSLDEVVVIGYGTTTNEALSGAVAGVKIRGNSSMITNKKALYVVDGVPVSANDVSRLNPDNIASMDILKDAASTAIYGSRGSNGVILISTKTNKNEFGVITEEGITNTNFKIDKKHNIPSDGDVVVIEIDKFSVPANYTYFAAPVLNENVFLTAKIGNWEQYNLLPAEANVYFEGSYSGKTNINPAATTDSLTISLGVDPNIVVKRTQLNDYKKSTFIGNNKVVQKAYEIEIRNNKTSQVELTLLDRIPKSQNKSIKIDDIETGTSTYDDDKGILKWKLSIKPGETETLQHAYSVKFPKGKRVNL
ncbi:mucoidy inhibitor MuiA family protein [Winogradskyella eckloniae]|uniref:mucoidy inhibitor MuiA family protein n=1 Tax=Winogradskyella eckloniae TaxID=1089306 RepID=UPI001563C970|nr:mucoidy inhibitor MuiA family protein [Winogradskyella eckloniae]NRD19994.1 mucoidy inhibitor MuiA family protein [Winogradskyella eckloniae]